MKCIRCGKELPEGTIRCDECDFNIQEYEKYKKVFKEELDPDVPKELKSNLIDNPILTFIFGVISLLLTLIFVTITSYIYIVGILLFVFLTLLMSTKPSKVNLRQVQIFGKVLAYISISLMIFKLVYIVLGILFF